MTKAFGRLAAALLTVLALAGPAQAQATLTWDVNGAVVKRIWPQFAGWKPQKD